MMFTLGVGTEEEKNKFIWRTMAVFDSTFTAFTTDCKRLATGKLDSGKPQLIYCA